jgi:hypothetical protein
VPVLKKVGVYGRTGTAMLLGVVPVGMPDEGPLPSEAEFEGGVNNCPTLTSAGPAWEVLIPERGGNFWVETGVNWRLVGGGSSNTGRFEAACLRWVKLDGALSASSADPIGRGIATDARVPVVRFSMRERWRC